jgi:hypothetical protein
LDQTMVGGVTEVERCASTASTIGSLSSIVHRVSVMSAV